MIITRRATLVGDCIISHLFVIIARTLLTMNKRSWLLYPIISLLVTACAPKVIQWSATRPLKWDDFLAGYNIGYDAHTYSKIRYSFHKQPVDGKYLIDFEVQSLFVPNQSWIKQGKETDTLLRHEQQHFDICELYTRKLYLSLTKHNYTSNYRNEIRSIAAGIFKELKQTQANYDAETQHFFNKAAQAAWEELIRQQLAQTAKYPHVKDINFRSIPAKISEGKVRD
jgi:hypothetical protein